MNNSGTPNDKDAHERQPPDGDPTPNIQAANIQGKGLFGQRSYSSPRLVRKSLTFGQRSAWVLGLIVLVAAATRWFWIGESRQFPVVAPGSYIGTVTGVFSSKGSAQGAANTESESSGAGARRDEAINAVPFYVERAPETEDLFVAVLAAGWKPQLVSTVIHAAGSTAPRWILPLIISQGERRLQLTGGAVAKDRYEGEALDLTSGREGTWKLEPIRAPPGDVGQGAQVVRLWLMLKAELDDVEARTREFERRVPEQRAEIEKLTGLLTEGEELRSRANEKFGSVQEGLAQAERELKQEHQKVQRLEASLEIAGKVTGMGKLVSLSRESLEREWRIVDSKLRSSADASAEDLEEEYERATRILEVQGQVANERAAIERLQRNHQESSEPRAQMRTPQRRPR